MRILAIGDIIGKPGRKAVEEILPGLYTEYNIDLVIGNGENAAGGLGLTPNTAEELFDSGIDVITTGNHIWAQKEIIPYLDSGPAVLRPLNYPPTNPGRGYLLKNNALIANLVGRVFIGHFDCPFRAMDQLLTEFKHKSIPIIVDFHAEATSEKVAMGKYLDGRVSAVLGTHTHVGTIDAHILPGGTAYVTDIGMVGPIDSVIGDDTDSVLDRFLTQMSSRLSVGKGKVNFDAILVEVDENTGKAVDIKRIQKTTD
ncbi:MAG: TIGR00282 family metallophosphoesterase [Dehalococcoidia bacterium]|nr:MAG: TIGR00282 family metallophosphoesterase [Dehalococcoidia bacterium]TEU16971.1 MAG: TIGR00282 family metallophosphoesterase [Dehalococcoidia bacterium]